MTADSPTRIAAIDWMRGLVMVLMALDHASLTWNGGRLAADSAYLLDPETGGPLWVPGSPLDTFQFYTRWVTHLCAYAQGCMMVAPDKSQTISVSLSSRVSALVSIDYYKGGGEAESSGWCSAYTHLSLSSFPTSRLATRPGELASALREITNEWSVDECTIWISYENDTSDEIAEYELCIMGSFKFDGSDYWSSSAEGNCSGAS